MYQNNTYKSAVAVTLFAAGLAGMLGGCTSQKQLPFSPTYDVEKLSAASKENTARAKDSRDLSNKLNEANTTTPLSKLQEQYTRKAVKGNTADLVALADAVNVADTEADKESASLALGREYASYTGRFKNLAPETTVIAVGYPDGVYNSRLGHVDNNVKSGRAAGAILSPIEQNLNTGDASGMQAQVYYVGGDTTDGGVQYLVAYGNAPQDTRLDIGRLTNMKLGYSADKSVTRTSAAVTQGEPMIAYTAKNDAQAWSTLIAAGVNLPTTLTTFGAAAPLAGGLVFGQYHFLDQRTSNPLPYTFIVKNNGASARDFAVNTLNTVAAMSSQNHYDINGMTVYALDDANNTTIVALSSVDQRGSSLETRIAKDGALVVRTQEDAATKVLFPIFGFFNAGSDGSSSAPPTGGLGPGGPQGGR